MAFRPRMALLVASITLAAACTTNTEVTNRTTPSDVFAPTPSIGDGTTAPPTTTAPTTTPPAVQRTYIARVDPRTLEELPEHAPLEMGDWMWGVTSDNGRWLAVNTTDNDGYPTGLRLVDVDAWEVAGEWPDVQNAVVVTDIGDVYGQRDLTIGRVRVGALEEPMWTAASNHSVWGTPEIDDDRYVSYGRTIGEDGNEGAFTIFTGDETGGALVPTPLTGIQIGLTEVVELAGERTGVIDAVPGMVWDADRQRALIVHATQDVVTEFDVTTFDTTDHVFGPSVQDPADSTTPMTYPDDASYWASKRRTARLSPDGARLYIAGSSPEFEDVDGATRSVNTPTGLLVVDTSSWSTITQLDIPVSEIYMSPDGRRLVATGGREESTLSSYSLESSGWYLIDTADMSVISHVEADRPDQWYGPMSFNLEANVAYVSSWALRNRVDVVDLDTGEVVASRDGDNVQMFGNAAVIADVVTVPGP